LEFRRQSLDNGLEIVAEVNPRAHSTAVAFFVRSGARDETDANSGVSHFLEHMAFKGTATRSAADVNRQLDEIGSHANAFTSEEQTVYHATVLPEYQDRAVELLADILRPALREEDFAIEKKVIIEEIRKDDDQPPYGGYEKCMAAYFGRHPLARTVLGTEASVGGLTPEAMRDYFQKRYSPGNIVLVGAGRVDFDSLVAAARRHCDSWEPFEAPRDLPPAEPRTGFHVLQKESSTQEYVVQISGAPSAEDPERYAARLLATIAGDDTGSRLFWLLVDSGLAEFAAMGTYEFQAAGMCMTYLCCPPEETAANLERVRQLQRSLERDGVTEAELNQAKNKICAHAVLASERPANRLFSIGNNWVQRRQYRTVKDGIVAYQAVTRDQVAAILARYPLSRSTTLAVGPLADIPPPD
jgi:predicted Zn-dependent peptidase